MRPEIQYVRSGDISIAWQVVGDGPDLIFVPPGASHLDLRWDEPRSARMLRRLASFSRLVMFDKRGTGLSDRSVRLPALEEQAEDTIAVMDAAGCERATLLGALDGAASALFVAVTHPERVERVAIYATPVRGVASDDLPYGMPSNVVDTFAQLAATSDARGLLPVLAPSVADDDTYAEWWVRYMRTAAPPAHASAWLAELARIDLRPLIPLVRVPTLILHREGDRLVNVANAHYLAAHIPDARLVILPGNDYIMWVGDVEALVDEVEEFITGTKSTTNLERVVASLLFADVVDSTGRLSSVGDQQWRNTLEQFERTVKRTIAMFGGRLVNTTGDGFLARFDGPVRTIRCAEAIREALKPQQLTMRFGVHTSEVEAREEGLDGLGVHITARIMAAAEPSEILVSRTVRDLIAGSGLRLESRGQREFKGVEGEWEVFCVS